MRLSWIKALGTVLMALVLVAGTTSVSLAQPTAQSVVQQVAASTAQQPSAPIDGEQCFQELDPEQRGRLEPYVAPQPGIQETVCILEPDGDGYDQQYYRESDGFQYFWYYLLLARTTRTTVLMTGVIMEPTLVEYIALTLWASVDKYGHPSTLYRKDSATGKWSRMMSELPRQVHKVSYGSAPPVPPNTKKTPPPPPAGYQAKAPVASTGSATVNRAAEKKITPKAATPAKKSGK